jgi:hypothetical protein
MKSIKQIRENYNIITEKEEADIKKLVALGRAGLFDMKKANFIKRALEKDPKDMTLSERKVLIELLDELMSQVLHSNQIYSKVKQNVRGGMNEDIAKYDPRFEKSSKKSEIKSLPTVIVLRRKAVRIYPDQQKIGLYYAQSIDKYISIPFGMEDSNISALNEADIFSTKKIKTPGKPKPPKPPKPKPNYNDKEKVARYDNSTLPKRHTSVSSLKAHSRDDARGIVTGGEHGRAAHLGGYIGSKIQLRRKKREINNYLAQRASRNTRQVNELAQLLAPALAGARAAGPAIGRALGRVVRKPKPQKPVKTPTKPADVPATVPTPTTPVKPPAPAPKPQPKKIESKPKAETKTKTDTNKKPDKNAKSDPKTGKESKTRKAVGALGAAAAGAALLPGGGVTSTKDINTPKGELDVKTSKAQRFDTSTSRKKQDIQLHRKFEKKLSKQNMREQLESIVEEKEFSTNNGKIIINKQIAEKILSLYESVNKDNKKKIESMLSESVESFKKIVEFAVRQ